MYVYVGKANKIYFLLKKKLKKKTFKKYLNMLDIFRIEEWKPLKLSLVKIHHEELVSWRQIQFFQGELLIKVAHVFTMFLCEEKKGHKTYNKKYLIPFYQLVFLQLSSIRFGFNRIKKCVRCIKWSDQRSQVKDALWIK